MLGYGMQACTADSWKVVFWFSSSFVGSWEPMPEAPHDSIGSGTPHVEQECAAEQQNIAATRVAAAWRGHAARNRTGEIQRTRIADVRSQAMIPEVVRLSHKFRTRMSH